ncbi:MAG TPA: inositol monophosphatase family protein [Acidimicrobiales bacterium]|nr:inositol monophosphatase family protein [Acidimicrobiales bacterium]
MTPADLSPALLDELTTTAFEVARGAATVLMRYTSSELREVTTKSSPTDLVSEADRASEQFITEAIRRLRPEDSFLGEEGSSYQGTSGVTWVADPLDGTTNYWYGIPAFAVSLAAVIDGTSVVGVVVDPSRDETWAATAGRGATCNGKPCRVAAGRSELATALVATGFGYGRERRARQASLLPRLLPAVRDIRRFGSAALDLCWVAGGRFDAYYESNLNEWDWAAGRLICQEAGGDVRVLAGEIVLAATPDLAGPLAQLIAAPYEGPAGH